MVYPRNSMPEIQYTLLMPDPHSHLFEVTMDVRGNHSEKLDFVLPVWSPGSYKIRDYPKNLQEFRAMSSRGGPLPWEKVDKSTWRVFTGGRSHVKVQYKIYAFNLSIRTSHLDATHGYFNGVSVFCYLDGFKDLPVTLKIEPYRNWHVSTGLEQVPGSKNIYGAYDYDHLVDCPTEIGTQKILEYEQRGVLFQIAVYGEGSYDSRKLVRDMKKLTGTVLDFFDEPFPFSKYVFLVQCVGGRMYNGLEHRNSTTLQCPRYCFDTPRGYSLFQLITTHEFFHAWNVKSFHSEVLGPFDYTKEVYTRSLWLSEGFSSYYDNLLIVRSGLMDIDTYLDRYCSRIEHLENVPGRKLHTIEEASFDAWLKHYQPDENTLNTSVSYYQKGSFIALLLDLEIRYQTNNRKSLDDVMRFLYRHYGMKGKGFPEDDLHEIMEIASGCDLGSIFSDHVYGKKEIPFNRYLNNAGMELIKMPDTTKNGGKKSGHSSRIPYLGILLKKKGKDGISVSTVLNNTPAYKQGIYANDEIIAVNGFKTGFTGFREWIQTRKISETIRLSMFRGDQLIELKIKLGSRAGFQYRIKKTRNATRLQKMVFSGWSGTKYSSWHEKETVVNPNSRFTSGLV